MQKNQSYSSELSLEFSSLCSLFCFLLSPSSLSSLYSSRFFTAGDSIGSPSIVNREPWHGQSHVFSALLYESSHPKWLHTGLTACRFPFSSLYIPIFLLSNSIIFPSPFFNSSIVFCGILNFSIIINLRFLQCLFR